MAVSWLERGAATAPVPTFVAVGAGARDAVVGLRRRPEIRLVASPRQATVLLVAGRIPDALDLPLARVHDQLAHPRATVWWGGDPPDRLADLTADLPGTPDGQPGRTDGGPQPLTVPAEDDVVDTVVGCHRLLIEGGRASEPHLLPDRPPTPWQGRGDHGQGGKGMMGGTPYGRPMAMTGPDRDGLALDQLPVTVGPFLAPFPAGLTLELTLQGDVIQEASVGANPFARPADATGETASSANRTGRGRVFTDDPFDRARTQPVSIIELEMARARHHLTWLAHALAVQGLDALAKRVAHQAEHLEVGDGTVVLRLARTLERTGTVHLVGAGIGRVPARGAETLNGPVARAAGHPRDARRRDPAYQRLGFAVVTQHAGDVSARWRQRLAETAQAVDLAQRAAAGGGIRTRPDTPVEDPRGQPEDHARLLEVLPELVTGLEFSQAVTTVVSLDLDLDRAAAGRRRVTADR